jgi:hypothetical protein
MKTSMVLVLIYVAIVIAAITGEVICIINAIDCNWEPVGKAEIIYTGASLTGLGCVVGYIDIQDN